jgi:hypothetical protein
VEAESFASVFDQEAHRLRGVQTWEDVGFLGRGNTERLARLASAEATGAFARGDVSRDDLRDLRKAIDRLRAVAAQSTVDKPYLPRLRDELFRRGDEIFLYIADSDGAAPGADWRAATVIDVAKARKLAWAGSPGNAGFYWQVTVESAGEFFPGVRRLRFSTTEPRAQLRHDIEWLRHGDSRFLEIFAANAWRDWQPIWCFERGTEARVETMDMAPWLRASFEP